MSRPSPYPNSLSARIDACLPQTQCTRCGYPRCLAYAEAVARGEAGINQCPPGGDVTIQALSALLHVPFTPLDPRFGSHQPRALAVIDESVCIGCRKCIDACPVDAILGARKRMHTVIARECSGCELCLPPCPVDCIAMIPNLPAHAPGASGPPLSPASERNEGEEWPEYSRSETARWRERTERRLRRLRHKPRSRCDGAGVKTPPVPGRERIRTEIRAAVERVKARKRRPGATKPRAS